MVVDLETAVVRRIIPLQYDPDTLSRTLQVLAIAEGDDRSGAPRLKSPEVEMIELRRRRDYRALNERR